MTEFIATPRGRRDQYPWRPMDNRERRAAWAVRWYCKFKAPPNEFFKIEKHGTG